MTIRNLRRSDLVRVADVHLAAFPDSALTGLGHEAVRRNYRWLLEGPHQAHALGAFEGDLLLGYSFCGIFNGALTGFLRANRAYLAWRVATHPWLVANPLFRDNIGLALRLLTKRGTPASAKPAEAPPYGILSIAVDPARHGSGVGRELMARNEAIAREHGFASMVLTVSPKNANAVRFYERGGWERVAVDGAWTKGLMTKRLA